MMLEEKLHDVDPTSQSTKSHLASHPRNATNGNQLTPPPHHSQVDTIDPVDMCVLFQVIEARFLYEKV